jgi:hypothetical protein
VKKKVIYLPFIELQGRNDQSRAFGTKSMVQDKKKEKRS